METAKKPTPQSDDIDLMRYVSLFISNWIWIAVALFLALGIAYVFNRYSQRVYTVSSTMIIHDELNTTAVPNMDQLFSADYYNPRINIDDEVIILCSFTLSHRVIKEMPDLQVAYVPVKHYGIQGQRTYMTSPFVVKMLSDNQPFGVHMTVRITGPDTYRLEIDEELLESKNRSENQEAEDSGIVQPGSTEHGIWNPEQQMHLGDTVNYRGFDFVIILRDPQKPLTSKYDRWLVWLESPLSLANSYSRTLSVEPVIEGSTANTLSFNGYSPRQCADYLNSLMQMYIEQGIEWKTREAEKTLEFIDAQLGLISDSLRLAENTMENFRQSNRFVDLTLEGNLVLQRLEKYENEKNMLELQMQYYEYLLDYLSARDDSESIISPAVMGVTDEVLVNLVSEFATLQQQRKQMAFTVKENLPQVQLIDQKLEDAHQSLHENVTSAISQLKISISNSDQNIAKVEQELGRLPGTERRLIGIQRKFDLNNSVYTYLLQRRSDAGIAKASQITDNRIIDKAMPENSSMVNPKPMRNYMFALILGLMLPAVAIVIIDVLNNKIIDKKDVEKLTGTPILGFISHSNYETEIPVIEKPGSTLAESFRSIRTSLKFFIPAGQSSVVAVTSTVSGEGKTFVSLNLAAIISLLGCRTLIVGLDLRRPRLHKVLGLDNSEGMSTFLSGNSKYESIIQKTSIDNLWFASSGPVPPNSAELIERAAMTDFMAIAREKFDYIIVDTPPAAVVTDALLLAYHADVTLFVVRQRYSSKNTIHFIDEIYRNRELKNPGIVVNDISMSGYYGYGLRYGYTMGYSYGYDYGHKYYGHTSYGKDARTEAGKYYTEE